MPAATMGRADPAEVSSICEMLAAEVGLRLQPAARTTRFCNTSVGGSRQQVVEANAGPISITEIPECEILHVAPVANEVRLDAVHSAADNADFVGLTAQGIIRGWDAAGRVTLGPVDVDLAAANAIDVVVVADYEYAFVAALTDEVVRAGGLAVVTRNVDGCTVLSKAGSEDFPAHLVADVVDDTGAGDVFAAALFVELYRGVPLAGAVHFAAVAAALSTRAVGATGLASREQITAHC
jgi:sugar/nucleoside kinase (ribokinase family)